MIKLTLEIRHQLKTTLANPQTKQKAADPHLPPDQ